MIGGASAGGNISAVLATLARDKKLDPPLTGTYLCVPALLSPDHVPERYIGSYISWAENTQDPVLKNPGKPLGQTMESIRSVVEFDSESPLFDPTLNERGLKNFPPTYLELGGMDPLRDDGLVFEKMLREENGVRTRLDLHEGFGHMFWMNFPGMKKSREAAKSRLEGIRWLLEPKNSSGL